MSAHGMSPEHHATWGALLDVGTERRRQDELRDAGRFKATLADTYMTPAQKLACIVEEVGEVARCVLAGGLLVQEQRELEDLRTELVHVAALSVAWIEALDRELRGEPC